jgi:large subunit ribosomal protein L9
MEVILREDIEKLGSRGQVVKVADGFARNFLLPRRLAVPATEANRKIIEQERQAALRREAKEKTAAEELARMLSAVTLTIKQKAGEADQLFGSVTAKDIAELLEKQGYTIDRKKILLDHPIKTLGEHKVAIKLHREVSVEIPVIVNKEEAE